MPQPERSAASGFLAPVADFSTAVIMNHGVLASSGVAGALGLVSHWRYFIRGEHHLHALLWFKLAFWLPVLSCLGLVLLAHVKWWDAVQLTGSVAAAYLGGLWTSMIMYRAFFHRLHRFPGPRLAKTSKLYHVCKLGQMDNFRRLAGWHQTYGDFVRIGKRGLTFVGVSVRRCDVSSFLDLRTRNMLGFSLIGHERCTCHMSPLSIPPSRSCSPPSCWPSVHLSSLTLLLAVWGCQTNKND